MSNKELFTVKIGEMDFTKVFIWFFGAVMSVSLTVTGFALNEFYDKIENHLKEDRNMELTVTRVEANTNSNTADISYLKGFTKELAERK